MILDKGILIILKNVIIIDVLLVGVVKDGITSHAVYAVTVVKSIGPKEIDSWVVYRRYSDFYDFHVRLEERVSYL